MLQDRFIHPYDRFCWKFMVIFDNFDLDALRRGKTKSVVPCVHPTMTLRLENS